MTYPEDHKSQLLRAKRHVKRIKVFYIHLVGYIVVVSLVLWNFLIMDQGPHEKAINWINGSTLVGWTIFIILHWWSLFKGGGLFKKSWEDKKIEKYMKERGEEKRTMWE